jgi:hypothetical protein
VPVFDASGVSGVEQNVAPRGAGTPQNRLVVTGNFSPSDDLILIRRVAPLMRVVKV